LKGYLNNKKEKKQREKRRTLHDMLSQGGTGERFKKAPTNAQADGISAINRILERARQPKEVSGKRVRRSSLPK